MLISPILFKLIHHSSRVLALLSVSSVAKKSIQLGLHPKVATFTPDLISGHTAWYTLTLPPMILATNTGKLEFNISHALGIKIIELKTPWSLMRIKGFLTIRRLWSVFGGEFSHCGDPKKNLVRIAQRVSLEKLHKSCHILRRKC